jgi:hypothetical protein
MTDLKGWTEANTSRVKTGLHWQDARITSLPVPVAFKTTFS